MVNNYSRTVNKGFSLFLLVVIPRSCGLIEVLYLYQNMEQRYSTDTPAWISIQSLALIRKDQGNINYQEQFTLTIHPLYYFINMRFSFENTVEHMYNATF